MVTAGLRRFSDAMLIPTKQQYHRQVTHIVQENFLEAEIFETFKTTGNCLFLSGYVDHCQYPF